jgi:hypothetical protein
VGPIAALRISHGPVAGPNRPAPGGGVTLGVDCIYHNSLIDEFNDLEARVLKRLDAIEKRLRISADLHQDILSVKDKTAEIARELTTLRLATNDQQARLEALRKEVEAARARL